MLKALKALTGVAAAIFGRKSAVNMSEKKPPECDGQLKGLVSRYREKCDCHGDQYGSWGPCELCKEPFVSMCDEQLKGLISRYRKKCNCNGDQYGSWGPCELCKEPPVSMSKKKPPECDGRLKGLVSRYREKCNCEPLVGDSRPSHNYRVTQTDPGKFHCEVMIQDGWERWDETSLESAKESVIQAAKFLNGTTLNESNICVCGKR